MLTGEYRLHREKLFRYYRRNSQAYVGGIAAIYDKVDSHVIVQRAHNIEIMNLIETKIEERSYHQDKKNSYHTQCSLRPHNGLPKE